MDRNPKASLYEKFKIFRQLLDMCEARGYDPYESTFTRYHKYNGLPYFNHFDVNGNLLWCLLWEKEMYTGYYHPQSGDNHPAILFINGREEWHTDGELHREDGPAVIKSNGTELWFQSDKKIDPPPASSVKSANKS